MVDRDTTPPARRRPPETVEEIATRIGRPLATVKATWRRHPAWPKPLPDKRGRWNQYAPEDIDAFVRDHIDRPAVTLEPQRLYTAQQLAAAGIGITAATIRADRARNRWPAPDDTTGGVSRWTGHTAAHALQGRRGYRRTRPEPGTTTQP